MTRRRSAAAIGQALCFASAALGGLGLVGWLTDVRALTTFVPGQPPMMPNTALALLVVGLAGALRREVTPRVRSRAALAAAGLVLTLAVATAAEYVFDVDLHIDQVVLRSEAGPYPGRMSPFTAAALAALAGAILAFDLRPTARARPSDWLVLFASLIAFTAVVGQLFGAGPLYRIESAPVTGVAIPTALSVLLTSAGLLLERPDRGVMRVVTSHGPGGILFRRLALPAVLAPVVLGVALSRLLASLGVEGFASAHATLAVGATVAGLSLLAITAAPLNRAQEELRRTMERFELALRGADLGAWDWNIANGHVTFNARWAEMRGLRLEEVEPHVDSWTSGVHPDDRAHVETVLRDYLEGRAADYEVEHRAAMKGGGWIWVLDRGRVFARDDAGRPTRMVGTELDITARKQAELALRLSEEKFSGIVSISPDAIISIDEGRRITVFNEGAESVFGYTREEALGAPIDILIPERLRTIHREHIERFATGPATTRRISERGSPIRGLRKNGEEFPAEAAISKLEVGGTRLVTVSLRDVTDRVRRETEKELLSDLGTILSAAHEYEARLEQIAQLAVRDFADACILELSEDVDATSERHVAIREPSRAWARELLARPLPPTNGRPRSGVTTSARAAPIIIDPIPEETLRSLAETDERLRALRALEPCSIIKTSLVAHDHPLGTMTFVSSKPARPFGRSDLAFVEEFARRASVGIENARLYRAAQRAIRARDDVLGIVAHDLRNPLGVILMQAQALQRNARGEHADREGVDRIERSAGRMNRLIQDLLDVTRMEAGRLSVDRADVWPSQLLSDVLESQRPSAATKALDLRLEAPSELPKISADRDRLLQVLENLIGNAMKFTSRGGRITVGAKPQTDETLFWVSDTGPGIPAADVPHVFERFWQVPTARHSGAGLGLPIVKGIVEAHGGRAWVESTVGRGSTFFFTIPERSIEDERPRPSAIRGPRARSSRSGS